MCFFLPFLRSFFSNKNYRFFRRRTRRLLDFFPTFVAFFTVFESTSFHWNTQRSPPPVLTTCLSLYKNRTLVTWLLWPLLTLPSAFGLLHGYLNNVTFPLSSPVTNNGWSLEWLLSTAFMSVPSCSACQMPWTGHPRTQVHVPHFTSRSAEAFPFRFPFVVSQNSNSYAPQLLCNHLHSFVFSS